MLPVWRPTPCACLRLAGLALRQRAPLAHQTADLGASFGASRGFASGTIAVSTSGSGASASTKSKGDAPEGLAVVRRVRPTTGDEAAAWIKQSMSDYYSSRGLGLEYRSGAAWSLRQMDDRLSILREGQLVVDLGCFPGGWSQVAVERTGAMEGGGRVIGVDKVKMDPLRHHTFVQGDISKPAALNAILSELGERRADVVLADVSPALVGLKLEDHLGSAQCCLYASQIMERVLKIGGWFVIKMLYGAESGHFRLYLNTRFEGVRSIRPPASRQNFREAFYICRGFRGREAIAEEVSTQGNFGGARMEGVDKWGFEPRQRRKAPAEHPPAGQHGQGT